MIPPLLLIGSSLLLPPPGDPPGPPALAAFTITGEVVRPAARVPPIGVNGYGRCGSIEWAANNFVTNSGNEPIWWRNLHRVTECGDRWLKIDGGGVSWWELWGIGFLSGANVRVYRIVDEEGEAITGEEYLDLERADHVELVGVTRVVPEGDPALPRGGWVVTVNGEGDRVYLVEGAPRLERFDYIVVERRFDPFDMRYVHKRVRGLGNPMDSPNWHWRHDPERVRLSLDGHVDPTGEMLEPGETCLRIDALTDEPARIEQFVFIGTELPNDEPIWYGQLEPGAEYRLEVWMRQEGLEGGGKVVFSYGRAYPDLEATFEVDSRWRRFTCEFFGPPRPGEHWHFGHRFGFTGPGTLWIDNAKIQRVHEESDLEAPYVPNATVLDELLAASPATGPKGAQRCWVLNRDATMDGLLGWHANSRVTVDWSTSVEGTVEMTIPRALELCRRTGESDEGRVVPWLVLQHILHDEADWRALIEYLAVPYDVERDSPGSKPWAHRRYTHRGTGVPWTDEFRELIIEFGNETWHNGVFDDWLGFHLRNAVWQGGPEYGLFCQYLIDSMRADPRWDALELDEKIRFALGDGYPRRDVGGGWRLTYGEEAMRTCPGADLLAHANYIGPKWETGDESAGRFDDHGVQACLLAYQTGNAEAFAEMRRARERLAESGVEYELAAYESGPSGYALPGKADAERVEVQERYGKSLAMGVAALDGWLGAYGEGWTHQCFFTYGQGQRWNSHTWFSEGFRPSPAWEAMRLRNRFARGDLVTVEETSVPELEMGGGRYPLVGCHAFREEGRWSVFLLSRVLDGEHDGVDFGDGATEVTLALPFRRARRITLHRLTGDPRETNREERRIAIESIPIPARCLRRGRFAVTPESGGVDGGLPPGSVFLYVFEE